jgi:hypothetical protein
MCIVPSQACASQQLLKLLHLKLISCQQRIHKVKQGCEQDCSEVSAWSYLSYKKLWNTLFGLPLLRKDLFEISVQLVPCREFRRPCSIKFLSTSQVEVVEVRILLSSQGFRKVNVEKSTIVFLSRSVLITFKSSESSKEVNPGSIEAFCYTSLCCYRERKALYTELFSFFSPPWSIP